MINKKKGNVYITWCADCASICARQCTPAPVGDAVAESTTRRLRLQHSPSSGAESELSGEVLCLYARQWFRERVGDHVVCRAVDELNGSLGDDVPNKVVPDIDMLRAGVVLVLLCECDGRLIVREECRGGGSDGRRGVRVE